MPGCFSQGETADEVLENVREAIACHLDAPLPEVLPERASVQDVDV